MQSFSSLVPLHLLQEGAAVAVEANLSLMAQGMALFRLQTKAVKPKAAVAQNIE